MSTALITHGITAIIGLILGAYLATKGMLMLWGLGSVLAFGVVGSGAVIGFKLWRKKRQDSKTEA